ncbi:hypothetical protein PUN28_016894 [Cardiocondyla obscurior]|uniref:Uncharacterized protein n=1 Tax=Cardiocondyla obscurior TaxID=286306 RepID=A0AAW2ERL8_9HYME
MWYIQPLGYYHIKNTNYFNEKKMYYNTFFQRIYIDSEPFDEVQIRHVEWIDPEEIHIKGFINIKKKYSIKNKRYRDRQYNIYIWMGFHEGGDVFGLRRLFDMEEDIAFAPESWS